MNIVWAVLLLVGGLVILAKSAELLVTGAVSLAKWLGVSPLIIGLTIVAMGTSAPEVAASIAAVAKGMGDVAIGNVYGSNIANLALVGGLAALIRPLMVRGRILQREMPVMLAVALLLWPVLHNLSISRAESILLLALFIMLILATVYLARKEEHKSIRTQEHESIRVQKSVLFIVIGLAGLTLGAKMTVDGAVFIGRKAGLSEAVIGLTIIAVGTSLPELMTCVVAAVKGHHDISIGNLVGSNVFNTLLVVGTAGVIRPFTIGARLAGVDYWVMIVVSAGFMVMALIGRRVIGRAAGALLLSGYVAYVVYLLAYSV